MRFVYVLLFSFAFLFSWPGFLNCITEYMDNMYMYRSPRIEYNVARDAVRCVLGQDV